ncbi:MAG: Co2+/Mg2+ efflux protein ApaG [Rickettsiaceae bacterium]|nr:Co2+/Mg2+ efflux protein ApaG [Rickettsiaceae bacterium]
MQLQEICKIPIFTEKTQGVTVSVQPFFADDLSHPKTNKYVYVYLVRISNYSGSDIKLISRKWHIIEEDGTSETVEGDGVIGLQPIIKNNEEFEYSSRAVLHSKTGMMYGFYYCTDLETYKTIEVTIPPFSLDQFSLDQDSHHEDN